MIDSSTINLEQNAVLPSYAIRLPKHLYIAWQFFMRPVNLHHQLLERGIDQPGVAKKVAQQCAHNVG